MPLVFVLKEAPVIKKVFPVLIYIYLLNILKACDLQVLPGSLSLWHQNNQNKGSFSSQKCHLPAFFEAQIFYTFQGLCCPVAQCPPLAQLSPSKFLLSNREKLGKEKRRENWKMSKKIREKRKGGNEKCKGKKTFKK